MAFPIFRDNDDVYAFLQDFEEYLETRQETKERAHLYFSYVLKGTPLQWYKAIARHLKPEEGETKYEVVVRNLAQAFGWKEDDDVYDDCEEAENEYGNEKEETDSSRSEESAYVEEKEETAYLDEKVENACFKENAENTCFDDSEGNTFDADIGNTSLDEIQENTCVKTRPKKRKFQEEVLEQARLKRRRLSLELTQEVVEAPQAPPVEIEGNKESAAGEDVESLENIMEPELDHEQTTVKTEPEKLQVKMPPTRNEASDRKVVFGICQKVQSITERGLDKVTAAEDKPQLNLQNLRSKSVGQKKQLSQEKPATVLQESVEMESPPTSETSGPRFNRRPPRQRLKERRTLTELKKPPQTCTDKANKKINKKIR